MAEKIKKWLQEHYILAPILVFIISTAFAAPFINETLVNPFQSWLHNELHPPTLNFTINPTYNIYERNGQNFIKVDLLNNGDTPLSNLIVDYQFLCSMNMPKRTFVQQSVVRKDELTYFEVATNLNQSCKPSPNPVTIEYYTDENGSCYAKITNGTTEVCMYCETQINLTATDYKESSKKLTKNFHFRYPFYTGELIFDAEQKLCKLYENAENKSALTLQPKRTVRISVFDLSIPCLRGEIPKDWCLVNGLLKDFSVEENVTK